MAITGSQPSYMYALGGYARGGATRGGDTDPQTYITIAGVHVGNRPAVAAQHVMDGTLSIVETEGDTPNTASFQVMGFQPTDGQEVVITQGSKNNLDRLFAGTILTDAHGYIGTPANYNETIHAIDFTWQLTRDTFSQRWQNTSATVIAQNIIAKVAGRGITSLSVAAGLPVLDEFSVTNNTPAQAMAALAARIGGYWRALYRSSVAGARADVRFGITTDTGQTDPTVLTLASAALTYMEHFSVTRDLSPVITRQAVEGGGSSVLADVVAGETILPVEEVTWFNAAVGGTVVSGPQRLAYTGTMAGGSGALVGPGAAPSSSPTITPAAGVGLNAGVYSGAYTYVTAAGESLPSPVKVFTAVGTIAAPSAPTAVFNGGISGNMVPGGAYQVKLVFALDHGFPSTNCTLAGPALSFTADAAGNAYLHWTAPADPRVVDVLVYRTVNGGSTFYLSLRMGFSDPGPNYYQIGTRSDATIVTLAVEPGVDTSAQQQAAVAGIAIGPAGTTSRKYYRTAVGGTQLKLQQTIANNTATTGVQDATADGSLGADAPISDTSLLSIPILNGGSFYTTGVTFSTNGAATVATSASPVFTSASYTFVAADVGAYVYIASGVNWTPGRYLIVSVAAGAATLSGACASVASPTAATWGVDYSALAAARVAYTDMVIDVTTSTKFTSAANPVGVNLIGNVVAVSTSVGFTLQRVIVVSVSGTTATCDKSLGTLSSTAGKGNLGGAAPATSVQAGATSLLLASAAAFSTSGGWAIAGSQGIRYTGITGNTLTGIPTSGAGAILASLTYNTTVIAAAALTGIPASGAGSILYPIKQGDAVNLRVVIDDTAAQLVIAALMLPTVDDGVIEGTVIQDGTISETEARARGTAQLLLRSMVDVAIAYDTRDKNAHASRTAGVNLPAPTNVVGSFRLQTVTIDTFTPAQWPIAHAHGASKRNTLEDFLRKVRGA